LYAALPEFQKGGHERLRQSLEEFSRLDLRHYYACFLIRILNAEFSVIPEQYDRDCHLEYPSGAVVHVLGICRAEFGPRRLRREWALLDKTAIWMQIIAHTG
jgi:hypothetical protein